jgi:hypothetical protein
MKQIYRLCGGISSKELEKFTKASYKKKKDAQNVNGYALDKELSTKRSKVYVDKNGKAVVTHAGTHSISDWKNNFFIPFGKYESTDRYKKQEKVTKAANAKYGMNNITTTTHSQSGETARILAKKGLTSKSVSLNPAIMGKSHTGVQVVRSKTDLVSALTPMGKNDVTIKAKTYSPLAEHSPSVLSRVEQEFGGRMKTRPRGMCWVE